MKRLPIDFARPSAHAALARMHPLAWLVVALALGVGAHAAFTYADLARQREGLADELRHAQSRSSAQAAARQAAPKAAIPEPQALAVNAAITQLNLPWRDVLDAIETATPATVALLTLEPDARRHLVKGTAEAQADEAMFAYIEQLKRQPFFRYVVLTRHEINAQDPNHPLRFQFEAQWEEGREGA